jgi:hypothetical protein
MTIVKSSPKVKLLIPKIILPLTDISLEDLTLSVGGKAGKSHYIVQVGDVQNMYKSSKPRRGCHALSTNRFRCIDLHGLTKTEAIECLNGQLPEWIDFAMHGHYPFVIPVEIICGCGNQILSEVVEQWIKANENVCNAPRNLKLPLRRNVICVKAA